MLQRNKYKRILYVIIAIIIYLLLVNSMVNASSANITRRSDLTQVELLYPSNIKLLLNDTNLTGLEYVFLKAQSEYNINAIFLISLAALESGWGTSNMATNKNNLFGFCAYDTNTSKAKTFKSKSECIMYVSKYISENYLTEGGKYYSGVTLEAVNKRYSSDKNWSVKIANIMDDQYKKLNKHTIANRSMLSRHNKHNRNSKHKILKY